MLMPLRRKKIRKWKLIFKIKTKAHKVAQLTSHRITNATSLFALDLDYDGDGKIDVRYTEEGEVIEESTPVSYEDLMSYIDGLDLVEVRQRLYFL